jgi:hypothetical protein
MHLGKIEAISLLFIGEDCNGIDLRQAGSKECLGKRLK